jgi:hypothetical protein
MDDAQRDRTIAAQEAWADAHRAYRDEVAKHLVWQMEGGPPPEGSPEPVTREEFYKLMRLREAEGAALAVYLDVLGET